MGNELNADGILDVLNAPDEPEVKGDGKEEVLEELPVVEDKPEEKEDKPEEDDDNELDLEEPEIKEDDVLLDKIPRRQEVLKEFPELYKKFPGIEKAIYREQQYAEVFPTPADAKAAVDDLKILNTLRQEVGSGSLKGVLEHAKDVDGEVFLNIAENFIPTLQQLDPKVHLHVVSNVLRDTLSRVYKVGKNADTGDDSEGRQLNLAARIVSRFLFHTDKMEDIEVKPREEKVNPKEEELTKREKAFNESRLKTAQSDVTSEVEGSIKKLVGFNIDKKDIMSPYVKSRAVDDVISQANKEIKDDARYQASLNKLWERAAQANYSKQSLEAIRNAEIAKAKSVLPVIIQKVRAEAIKGRSVSKEQKDEKPVVRGKASPNTSSVKKAGDIPKGMSTRDFLMQD